jgi:hypothetical protein
MDAAVACGGAGAAVPHARLARASAWTGGAALGAWALGGGFFVAMVLLRDVPDLVMGVILGCVGLSLCLALAGVALAVAALMRREGERAMVGLGLSLLALLLVYLAPALGIIAAGLLSWA